MRDQWRDRRGPPAAPAVRSRAEGGGLLLTTRAVEAAVRLGVDSIPLHAEAL